MVVRLIGGVEKDERMEEAALRICALNPRSSMMLFGKSGKGKRECRILASVDAKRHFSNAKYELYL